MRMAEYFRFAPMRAALGALVLAFAYALWALVGAFRAPTVPAVATHAPVALALRTPAPPRPVDIDAAIKSDLFSPDRQAPEQAYRLPGEPPPHAVATVDVQKPTVLGTAVAPNGFSFATAEIGARGPRIVHEGDKLGDYTVKTIERGHVVFVASDGSRLDIAEVGVPNSQEASNASNDQATAVADSAYRAFFARGSARGRGSRPRRDSIP
jgi:hypothetical protein